MLDYRLLIALGAGLVAAVVFASATAGPLLIRMVLFSLTALPLFLAGLGLGTTAALVAGVSATALVFFAGSPVGALIFAIGQAGPVFILVYLASLNRTDSQGAVEWYPVGRLIVAAALMSGAFAAITLLLLGGDLEALRAGVRAALQGFLDAELGNIPDGQKLGPEELDEAASYFMAFLPVASGITTMGCLLFNFWLAGRITRASGRLQRPWPDLGAMTFPPSAPLLLAGATAASFLSDLPGLIARSFSGPLFLAYVLLGLAVVHYVTRGKPLRPIILWVLYALLFVTNSLAALVIALMGLTESIWPMRQMPPPSDDPRPPD
ncbi:DUF2232 domain-containing protein [Hyphomicrobium sp. D-2]|uniref:DUF2232 domain-containing protein n=1 Tax=Hyphomicrobium sp. D-2 TaxID=3041621 RepID=UPI00245757D1|nr:DUF2232 domain-containing protein [Hyphomicrobium sp. D-2]MDH4981606.1 DUF2232 domain-containing protein [Hyphomicrobium sp. D-2]